MDVDTVATERALKDLRRARRRNRIKDIHWIDALYNVYLTAGAGIILVLLAAGRLDQVKLTGAHLQQPGRRTARPCWACSSPWPSPSGCARAVGADR